MGGESEETAFYNLVDILAVFPALRDVFLSKLCCFVKKRRLRAVGHIFVKKMTKMDIKKKT
ncbi:hypothetical protein CIG75_16710 [Tumebacillus algifaecis]|uniref:Uncharacterized protein n=1 Tax=Tumebacillus algifaecis TaxID=1214604 RepID=A0A223D4T4_9BACL|nr:hypothetical protein CIG75_16710 [Tumebacillus algifaecis]